MMKEVYATNNNEGKDRDEDSWVSNDSDAPEFFIPGI